MDSTSVPARHGWWRLRPPAAAHPDAASQEQTEVCLPSPTLLSGFAYRNADTTNTSAALQAAGMILRATPASLHGSGDQPWFADAMQDIARPISRDAAMWTDQVTALPSAIPPVFYDQAAAVTDSAVPTQADPQMTWPRPASHLPGNLPPISSERTGPLGAHMQHVWPTGLHMEVDPRTSHAGSSALTASTSQPVPSPAYSASVGPECWRMTSAAQDPSRAYLGHINNPEVAGTQGRASTSSAQWAEGSPGTGGSRDLGSDVLAKLWSGQDTAQALGHTQVGHMPVCFWGDLLPTPQNSGSANWSPS